MSDAGCGQIAVDSRRRSVGHEIGDPPAPLAPGEETKLIDRLGRGEVMVKLDALGPSEIHETRYPGVWLVTHFNEEENIIGRFIEITLVPEILKAQQEDMLDALTRLQDELLPGADDQTGLEVD